MTRGRRQVASAVKNEEDLAILTRGGASGDGDGDDGDSSSSDDDDDDDDGVDIDVEGDGGGNDGGGDGDVDAGVGGGVVDGVGGGVGTAEEREKRRLIAHNLAPADGRENEGDTEVTAGAAAAVAVAGGERQTSRRKRAETLGERVLNATAQCQACLYDIAMVPCKVRRRGGEGASNQSCILE